MYNKDARDIKLALSILCPARSRRGYYSFLNTVINHSDLLDDPTSIRLPLAPNELWWPKTVGLAPSVAE